MGLPCHLHFNNRRHRVVLLVVDNLRLTRYRDIRGPRFAHAARRSGKEGCVSLSRRSTSPKPLKPDASLTALMEIHLRLPLEYLDGGRRDGVDGLGRHDGAGRLGFCAVDIHGLNTGCIRIEAVPSGRVHWRFHVRICEDEARLLVRR